MFTQQEEIISDPICNFDSVWQMKSAELLRMLRRMGLRTHLNGRVFSMDALTEGYEGYSPSELILALRQQVRQKTNHLERWAKRRIRYFYQVQMLGNAKLREWMSEYVGMTFVPGNGKFLFPERTTFYPIDDVEAVTMSMRLNCHQVDGKYIDNYDIKTHLMELDRENGCVKIGGLNICEGTPNNLTLMARLFGLEPSPGPQALPSKYAPIYEAALAMHEDIEIAAVSNVLRQTIPMFPRVHLGFTEDDIQPEYTAGLKRDTLAYILGWVNDGAPLQSHYDNMKDWPDDIKRIIFSLNYDMVDSWSSFESFVGRKDALYLLDWNFQRNIRPFRNYYLIPLDFLHNRSEQISLSDKTFIDLTDHLGRKVVDYNGVLSKHHGLAKIQTIGNPALEGRVGNTFYEFSWLEEQ